jgi:hypothetical protein
MLNADSRAKQLIVLKQPAIQEELPQLLLCVVHSKKKSLQART